MLALQFKSILFGKPHDARHLNAVTDITDHRAILCRSILHGRCLASARFRIYKPKGKVPFSNAQNVEKFIGHLDETIFKAAIVICSSNFEHEQNPKSRSQNPVFRSANAQAPRRTLQNSLRAERAKRKVEEELGKRAARLKGNEVRSVSRISKKLVETRSHGKTCGRGCGVRARGEE